jgi:hypothetical protein
VSKRLCQAAVAIFYAASAGAAAGAELGVHDEPACYKSERKGLDNVAAFAKWLGRRPDRILEFTWFPSWDSMLASTSLLANCWRAAGYTRLAFAVAMLPRDEVSTLAAGAKGEYDSWFARIGQALVAAGYSDAIIRIGWEFNIPGYPWYAAQDPDSFVKFWRRIVIAMRAVPGAAFTFDWCPLLDMALNMPGRIAPDRVYPGDEFVDYIGMDLYNQWWGRADATSAERWQTWVSYSYGLGWQRDFAARHGKKLSFPEWGTGTRPNGHGLGDDPDFIRNVADWISANGFAYHDYWDEEAPDYNSRLSNGQYPHAGAAFIAAFGKP